MSNNSLAVRLFVSLWSGLDGVRKILHLLLLVVLFVLFFGVLSGSAPSMPAKAALLIQPAGPLVEQLDGDAYDLAIAELLDRSEPQTRVQDIIDALEFAKTDKRIVAVHLELSGLASGGLSKLRRVGAAIDDFKESGKPVVASADFYTQSAYYLAAHADETYLHPEGMVFLQGYGGYRSYYKEIIDTLRIDWNVFRVGTHKSFVEPYTRMDMSPEDRESRTRLITELWSLYLGDVELARGLDTGVVDDFTQNFLGHVQAAGGDMAVAAEAAGLVDALLGRAELRSILKAYAGEDESDSTTYAAVGSRSYLYQKRLLEGDDTREDNIAIVVASGTMLNGTQPPGSIGGESTARLLRQALRDDSVSAVVLRVDSPGGSVFASEVIAHEIVALREAGKPVVASMGSVAASAGYRISVATDKIVASPATITGSIGVFGMFPTYQRALETIGIATDGVGTTPWAGQLRPDREMSDEVKQIFQASVEFTYESFVAAVAEQREMDVEAVDKVAQGKVWTGQNALEIGLIDELGTFDDAIVAAADLAGLEADSYGQRVLEVGLSPTEQLIMDFLATAKRIGIDPAVMVDEPTPLESFAGKLDEVLASINAFDDPKAIYSHCFCEID